MNFGQRSLSHPLVVEAIEDCFAPVLVYNNRKGDDAALLERFGEPAWNNPVVRYLGRDGRDVIPRKDRVWALAGTVSRMVAALEASSRPVPRYLRLLRDELDAQDAPRVVVTMHCFWEGEGRLGGIDAVAATRPVFVDGREGVELTLRGEDDISSVLRQARQLDCAERVYVPESFVKSARREFDGDAFELPATVSPAKRSDDKHALLRSPLRFVPLSRLQATRVNAALHRGDDPLVFLSPRQVGLAERVGELLASDPNALKDLTRPDDPNALCAYQETLEARLGG